MMESKPFNRPKKISMYRKSKHKDEEGFDYIFIKSYGSLRVAEKDTKITRFLISKSLKERVMVAHPNPIHSEVLFAPMDNELNSNEKHLN